MKKKVLHEGKFKRLVIHRGWEYVERVNYGGVVVVLAVTDRREIVLIEQFRVPVGRNVIELPAGLAGDTAAYRNETLSHAAHRELLEETGYRARRLTSIFRGPVTGAICGDIMTLFRARGVKKVSHGGGDGTESIREHTVPLHKVDAWLTQKARKGCYIDSKVYAALYFLTREGLHPKKSSKSSTRA